MPIYAPEHVRMDVPKAPGLMDWLSPKEPGKVYIGPNINWANVPANLLTLLELADPTGMMIAPTGLTLSQRALRGLPLSELEKQVKFFKPFAKEQGYTWTGTDFPGMFEAQSKWASRHEPAYREWVRRMGKTTGKKLTEERGSFSAKKMAEFKEKGLPLPIGEEFPGAKNTQDIIGELQDKFIRQYQSAKEYQAKTKEGAEALEEVHRHLSKADANASLDSLVNSLAGVTKRQAHWGENPAKLLDEAINVVYENPLQVNLPEYKWLYHSGLYDEVLELAELGFSKERIRDVAATALKRTGREQIQRFWTPEQAKMVDDWASRQLGWTAKEKGIGATAKELITSERGSISQKPLIGEKNFQVVELTPSGEVAKILWVTSSPDEAIKIASVAENRDILKGGKFWSWLAPKEKSSIPGTLTELPKERHAGVKREVDEFIQAMTVPKPTYPSAPVKAVLGEDLIKEIAEKGYSPEIRAKIWARYTTSPERHKLVTKAAPAVEKLLEIDPTIAKGRGYLYGSFASTKPTPSDIDIMLRAVGPSKVGLTIPQSRAAAQQALELLKESPELHPWITSSLGKSKVPSSLRPSLPQGFMAEGKRRYGPAYDWIRLWGGLPAALGLSEYLSEEER